MNYLEMVQELQSKAAITGPAIPAVTNLTGMSAKLANWVQEAWMEIQRMREDWLFMINEAQVTLTIGEDEYDVITDFGLATVRWFDPNEWLIEDTPQDRSWLEYIPWQDYKRRFGPAVIATSGRPGTVTQPMINTVKFNVPADKAYKVTLRYCMTSEVLADDSDEPSMPDEYHMAIVWKALEHYAFHESAPELLEEAQKNFRAYYRAMCRTQLRPSMYQPEPLA